MNKPWLSIYKIILIVNFSCVFHPGYGQLDSLVLKKTLKDTSTTKMNMDAVYNRPFLTASKLPIAIGGYLEANTQYASTDGVSDGLSFQMRRMTLFFSATIAKKIKFLSELELEDGTKEINLEFAAMDMEFHPLLNLRGGIVMNPIGAFNQNHDGPRWEFIDRPLSATTIIPSTLSNVGFGLYGKYFSHAVIIGYEAYLTNGFDDKIISNSDNRTSLAAGKLNPARFEESPNGMPLFTGKIALRKRNFGEIGISHMSGIYNTFQIDGLTLDKKRKMQLWAIDCNTSLLRNKLNISAEISWLKVDVPTSYTQNYAQNQWGSYVDFVYTLIQKPMLGWNKAKINAAIRLEYLDYNAHTFRETGGKIYDEMWAIAPGLSFRPAGTTVLRFNYRLHQNIDLLGNPPSRTGIIQAGFSTYF